MDPTWKKNTNASPIGERQRFHVIPIMNLLDARFITMEFRDKIERETHFAIFQSSEA